MNKFNALLMLKKQLNNMTDEQIKEIQFKIYSNALRPVFRNTPSSIGIEVPCS